MLHQGWGFLVLQPLLDFYPIALIMLARVDICWNPAQQERDTDLPVLLYITILLVLPHAGPEQTT